jgi:hypothetical protein
MKLLHGFHWLVAAALAALLPVTARTAAGHGMGGNMGGGNMGMTPHFSSGRGFGHGEGRFGGRDFGRFRRDRFIDRGDRFFDRRDRFIDRGDRFFDRRDRFFDRRDRFLIVMTVSSFAITIVSSLLLISLRLASLGGTPILIPMPTPTTGTPTVIPLMTTDRVTITGIGTHWPCQCNRNLPGEAITMALLTG